MKYKRGFVEPLGRKVKSDYVCVRNVLFTFTDIFLGTNDTDNTDLLIIISPCNLCHPCLNFIKCKGGLLLDVDSEVQLVELLLLKCGRSIEHDIATTVVLGEGDAIADAIETSKE